jgi:hypothetical protein
MTRTVLLTQGAAIISLKSSYSKIVWAQSGR